MVVCPSELGFQADVVFVIEGTAINGAYINDLKTNYIVPSLEYFGQGNLDENNYVLDQANCLYGIVVYYAADCLPRPSCDTYGPFSSPSKMLAVIDKLELIGGKAESHANIGEGLAMALQCFEELNRDIVNLQKHCILICNSPPYSIPVFECQQYLGQTVEQLASTIQEKNINLSVISARKIPSLYKLYEKAGGDLAACQTKNYAKDPRHLVLLKGYSLKERPLSPPTVTTQSQIQTSSVNSIPSVPSPLARNDSPAPSNPQNNSAVNSLSTSPAGGSSGGPVSNNMYRTSNSQEFPNEAMGGRSLSQQIVPPQYQPTSESNGNPVAIDSGQISRPQTNWQMLPPSQQPQPRPNYTQTPNTSEAGSALIAQLSQPVLSMNRGFCETRPQMPNNSQNQSQPVRERHNIWQGLLEWIDKSKGASDQQKITKHVPCQVSTNSKDGEPELKADGWPSKLIMQLMPKNLIGNIGGSHLRQSISVLFHPQPCEALESLTKVMMNGFAGCVHFPANTSTCDIKVLILLYTAEKRAYLGFIPSNQVAFIDRLRRVIQQQKQQQQQIRPDGSSIPGLQMNFAQTNSLAMGGGQITQNPSQQGGLGQSMVGMNPQIRMGGMQASQGNMQPGMMNAAPQRAPFENQLEVDRRQNLEKINQLKQTLEAAQQQEQQYKSQLERISHMKTLQLQEALNIAQQTELKYRLMEQQRQAGGSVGQPQQQRVLMPGMANNQQLRHLLQQQPSYRPQVMVGMQQQMGNNGPRLQMGQQIMNQTNNQQGNFDDVTYDFN